MHPDQQAILNAIFAAPDDDSPRLELSDWLEEHVGEVPCERCDMARASGYALNDFFPAGVCPGCHGTGTVSNGYAARAKFVRLQVHKERKPPAECVCRKHLGYLPGRLSSVSPRNPHCRHCEMVQAELRFALSMTNQFRPSVEWGALFDRGTNEPTKEGRPTVFVSRGFVSRVVCTQEQFLEHAEKLFAWHPVQRVRLTDVTVDFSSSLAERSITVSVELDHRIYRLISQNFYTADQANQVISDACVKYGESTRTPDFARMKHEQHVSITREVAAYYADRPQLTTPARLAEVERELADVTYTWTADEISRATPPR
jgi:uncharacterized protein (TIGR02996 family)